MDEDDATFALKCVKKVLDEEGLVFWLDTGTLLGAVRNGRFIPWDSDIDLGAWNKNIDVLKNALKKIPSNMYSYVHENRAGRWKIIILYKDIAVSITLYEIQRNRAIRHYNLEQCSFAGIIQGLIKLLKDKRNAKVVSQNIPLDITEIIANILSFIPTRAKSIIIPILEKQYEVFSSNQSILVSIPKEYFENLSAIEFYDMEYNIPSPVEDYLEYRYGSDWRTPKEKYVHYVDDGGIMEVR